MHQTTHRTKNAKRLSRSSVAPDVTSSCFGGHPSVHQPCTWKMAKKDVLDEVLSNGLEDQWNGVSENRCRIAPKGVLGAAAAAGVLLQQQKNAHENLDDEARRRVEQQAGGKRKSSVKLCGAGSHLPELHDVHPSPDETRAVAVQTDPESVCVRDTTVPTAVSDKAQQAAVGQTPGVLSAIPLAVDASENARLQRRSSAPGDILSQSRAARRSSMSSSVETYGFDGGMRPDAWQHVRNKATGASTLLLKGEVELDRPVSGADENLVGSTTGSASFDRLHREDPDKSSTAASDTRDLSLRGNGDNTENSAAPGMEDLVLRQQGTLGRGGGGSPPGAVDPLPERKSAIDGVTRQLQEILREDALQDDGGRKIIMQARSCAERIMSCSRQSPTFVDCCSERNRPPGPASGTRE